MLRSLLLGTSRVFFPLHFQARRTRGVRGWEGDAARLPSNNVAYLQGLLEKIAWTRLLTA
jgi:hypothetical protein